MTLLLVGPESNGCQQTVHSTQKVAVDAITLMSYFKSTLIRDINFSLVRNMIYTKLMYRSSGKGKD